MIHRYKINTPYTKRLLLCGLLCTLLYACGMRKTGINLGHIKPDQTLVDTLADQAFSQEAAIDALQDQKKKKTDTLLQENMHVPGQTDTIFTYHIRNSIFRIYKAKDRRFIFYAKLLDPVLRPDPAISIGMKQTDFSALFPKVKAENKYIRIRSPFLDQYIDFYFKHARLYQIEYQGYLD